MQPSPAYRCRAAWLLAAAGLGRRWCGSGWPLGQQASMQLAQRMRRAQPLPSWAIGEPSCQRQAPREVAGAHSGPGIPARCRQCVIRRFTVSLPGAGCVPAA